MLALPQVAVAFRVVAKSGSPADAAAAAGVSWRELAVARSLDSARTRAENRVQRFLDAALELIDSGEGKEFTVQEVVARSGQSLRSFYQYFGGKHELLLALLEESLRATAEHLRERVEREDDPLERLHRFVVECYRICSAPTKGRASKRGPSPVLVEFAQQLLTAHPAEAARAFGPLVALFDEILEEAASAGVIRAEMRHRRIVGVVLESIMFNVFASTIAGAPAGSGGDAAEELWDLLLNGVGA
jgi:AcrR family transcriptional regulator